jgi:tight adherence protein C
MAPSWTSFENLTWQWSNINWMIAGLLGLYVLVLLVQALRRHRRHDNAPSTEIGLADSDLKTSQQVSWTGRQLFHQSTITAIENSGGLPNVEPHEVPTVDTRDYVFGRLTPTLAELLPESHKRQADLKKELKAAGYYGPHAWQNLAAIRYMAMMGSLLVFGGLLFLAPKPLELPLMVLMVVFSGAGWAIPRLYIRNKAAERTSGIEHAMPDMLDMLNMCVSQGLTVQESFRRISGELGTVYPHLAKELDIVREQAEVGTMPHALKNFADRIDVPEVQSFTSLLIQTERMGTSVSLALEEYSDNFREAHRQLADQKANNATFKLLFPTVFCLMPAVYLFLLGPAVIELSDFFQGGGRDAIDSGRQALEQVTNR